MWNERLQATVRPCKWNSNFFGLQQSAWEEIVQDIRRVLHHQKCLHGVILSSGVQMCEAVTRTVRTTNYSVCFLAHTLDFLRVSLLQSNKERIIVFQSTDNEGIVKLYKVRFVE